VMEQVEGALVDSAEAAEAVDRGARVRAGRAIPETLAALHEVDLERARLAGMARAEDHAGRQLRRWSRQWEASRTRELPLVDELGARLREAVPPQPETTIVHGDFRLGNTLFASQAPAHLKAVLDWEMATIGDPLADIGYLCMMWSEAGDPTSGLREQLGNVTRAQGFPTRAELIERYEQRSGRSMSNIRWYTTLALWKSVVFMEGNYKRAIAGTTDDPYLKQFGEGVLELARQAEDVAHGH